MANGTKDEKRARADRIREQSELAAKRAEQHRQATQNAIANVRRSQLPSYDDWEETSEVKIPSSAPPRIRAFLGLVSGLTPRGRLVLLLAIIAAITFLTWSFGPAVLGMIWRV